MVEEAEEETIVTKVMEPDSLADSDRPSCDSHSDGPSSPTPGWGSDDLYGEDDSNILKNATAVPLKLKGTAGNVFESSSLYRPSLAQPGLISALLLLLLSGNCTAEPQHVGCDLPNGGSCLGGLRVNWLVAKTFIMAHIFRCASSSRL